MSSPVVLDFLFDDVNEAKIAAHKLSTAQVRQVLDNEHEIVPNRKGKRGLHLVVGRDNSDALISVPIEGTHRPDLWRPITAWPSKKGERAILERKGAKRHG